MTGEKHSITTKFLSACLVFFCLTTSAQTVVDAETDEPVPYASVFDKALGKYIGNSDGSGVIPSKAEGVQTIALQHMNYQPTDVCLDTVTDGKIRLTPLVHSVREVSVDKGKHDFIRMKVYMRQLAWMTDTLAKVSQAICHLYFKASKGCGSPYETTIISSQSLYNKDVFSGKNGKMSRLIFNYSPDRSLHIYGPERLKNLPEDKVKRLNIREYSKNFGVCYARFDWKNELCHIVNDSIYFFKPFSIPFIGISVSKFFSTETYDIHYGAPKLYNLSNMLYGHRVTHKKSNTNVDLYGEMYVLDVDYASKEDLEEERQNHERVKFEEPKGCMPFNENVRQAMLNMRPLTYAEKKELLEEQAKMKKQKTEE